MHRTDLIGQVSQKLTGPSAVFDLDLLQNRIGEILNIPLGTDPVLNQYVGIR